MLFTRPGLEQASSELAAAHSAARLRAFPLVADLCCGIGGNLAALAAGSGRAGRGPRPGQPDSPGTTPPRAVPPARSRRSAPTCATLAAARPEAVFIDPARRSGGRRLRAGD